MKTFNLPSSCVKMNRTLFVSSKPRYRSRSRSRSSSRVCLLPNKFVPVTYSSSPQSMVCFTAFCKQTVSSRGFSTSANALKPSVNETAGKFLKGNIIDGKAISADIKKGIKSETDELMKSGLYNRRPHLSVILVGNDPASEVYVRNKAKAAHGTGITSDIIKLPDTVSQENLLQEIESLNSDPDVDGILVQLPLPKHISERTICDSVSPAKDVDGFNVLNVGKLCVGQEAFIPATPAGCLEMIKRLNVETRGKNAVVIGRSKIVGLPLALQFCSYGQGTVKVGDATTTICHGKTPKDVLKFYSQNADILVAATGVPKLVTVDMVKDGAMVIDVGISRITDANGKSKLVGDVDFENVQHKAGMITPVPGGVGPLTIAMVIGNTLTAYKRTFGSASS